MTETGVFAGRYIAVEFGTRTPFKTKQQFRKLIIYHGGIISFIVTRKVHTAVSTIFQSFMEPMCIL